MKRLIVITEPESDAARFVSDVLKDTYKIQVETDPKEVIRLLDEESHDIIAVIVDRPNTRADVQQVLDYMKENNTVIFAVPALVLTDEENSEKDLEYLSNPVVDTILMGSPAAVVQNRVQRASQFVSSVSFDEFARMLQVLPSLIYLKDAKGKYVFCTQYWHHLEHYDDPDWTIRGKTDMEIRKDQENARKAYESDMRILKTGMGTSYIIEENEDGQQEFLQLIKEPLKYEDGRIRGIIALINNVTEQENLKRKLEKMSFTDELTGLYNRAYMDVYTKTLNQSSFPLSIISADCDHLKLINDKYGHMMGDEYIRMSVTLMKSILPENSVICRMGGDEFLAFLPKTDDERAREYLKMLEEMEDIFQIHGQKLSVSFGSSTMQAKEGSFRDAIELSDAEMYRNKQRRKYRA